MPDLYPLYLGPINVHYYQQHFARFEQAGKVHPAWNNAAAFFTLAWLVLRKLWRPAAGYVGLWLVWLALWWWGLHLRVAPSVEVGLWLLVLAALCIGPGLMGNALYYRQVRQQTLLALGQATSLRQAQAALALHAVTPLRLSTVAGLQCLAVLLVSAALWLRMDVPAVPATTPPPPTVPAGHPDGVIPPVGSITPRPAEQVLAPLTTAAPDPEAISAPEAPVPPAASVLLPPQPPAARAASTAAATPAAPQGTDTSAAPRWIAGKFYIHAGVYAQPANVQAAVKKLEAAQLSVHLQHMQGKNGALTRLRVGPFDSQQQAQRAAAQMQEMQIPHAVFQQKRVP